MSDKTFNELHVCMGLNSCKNNGYSNSNDCAGMGDCATVTHPCHTLNDCKGQGGCGLFGTTPEMCHPGMNTCRYQGSCGSPILDSRFIAQGPNKGRSVWQLARARFEDKMKGTNTPVGAPPGGAYGPSNDYVNQVRGTTGSNYEQCGQSGNRSCSYAQDKTKRIVEASERVEQMAEKSAQEMPNTISKCPPRVY